jgi:hypothetical protein
VHVGGHVTGIDGVDAQVRMLGGEDGGELVQRRLARAVTAPALVGLHSGVGADADHAGARCERRQHRLEQRQRGDGVDGQDPGELLGAEIGQAGERARAQVARVVDQEVQARAHSFGQRGPVRGVGDVAGNGDDQFGVREGGGRRGQPVAVAGVDDEPPAAAVQRGRQCPSESSGGAGDECGGDVHGTTVEPQVHLRSRGCTAWSS